MKGKESHMHKGASQTKTGISPWQIPYGAKL